MQEDKAKTDVYAPSYYKDFKCIADKCKHNCCIGWEIDIDEDTLEYYNKVDGSLGQRFKENISLDDCPHFILRENDRCPFLNSCGLCDIITELGDEALCDICADHPRYRNYFADRLEMGLGLACEEAARLVLSQKEKTVLVDLESGEKTDLFPERQKIIDLLQNRSIPFYKRLEGFFPFKQKDFFSLYSSLERLDNEWDKYIELLKADTADNLCEWDTVFEQLAVYFVLRHTAESFEAGVLFSIYSVYIIQKICSALKAKNGTLSFAEIVDICRMYSSEIEYSDQNIEKIVSYIQNT